MSAAVPAPTRADQRFEVMDVLRGFALCGILLMNIIAMGSSTVRYFPSLPAVLNNPDWIVWFVHDVAFEGSMRGLFTLLFGAGMILIVMRGGQEKDAIAAADIYFRRCIALVALGVVNFAGLLFPGDVLYIYGISGLFLFAFRRAGPRVLLLLAAAIIAVLMLKTGAERHERAQDIRDGRAAIEAQASGAVLTAPQLAAIAAHDEAMTFRDPSPEALSGEVEARTGGYLSVLKWSVHEWTAYAASPYAIIIVLESIAFMFMGMALYKLGVITGERPMAFYAVLSGVGYAVGLTFNLWEALSLWHVGFSPELWLPASTYELGRWGMTFGHLGLIVVLWKLNLFPVLGIGLKAIGRMALTNYLGQSLIAAALFYGLGWWDHLSWAGLWGLAAAVWVFQGAASVLWLRHFRFGPMEWLLRAVAYGRFSPMRLERPVSAQAAPARAA